LHADTFLREVAAIAERLDRFGIENIARELDALRNRGGRLFLLGLGGSAANCSHAAADFRKLCGIQAQAPTDNMAEFSARANDEGFRTVFTGWLKANFADGDDALLVLSVGGGTEAVSQPITDAVRYAQDTGLAILGIVGPDGGVTAELGDVVLKVPAPGKHVTPHTEAFQAVIWHLLVSHPLLQRNATKW
jgi:D-sedoheptulose 7-phosphate isomerase